MNPVRQRRFLAIALAAGVGVTLGSCRQADPAADGARVASGPPVPAPAPSPAAVAAPDPFSWAAAIAHVEEVRGSAGRITTPEELHHYSDRRRFLAVQMADSREERYALPHDVAALAQMIQRGELVGLLAGKHPQEVGRVPEVRVGNQNLYSARSTTPGILPMKYSPTLVSEPSVEVPHQPKRRAEFER